LAQTVAKNRTPGGEGRLAAVDIKPINFSEYQNLLPPCPRLTQSECGRIRFTLSLITPCSSDNMELLIRKGPANAPGRCVSACIGKPQLYGGWDLKNEEPRPLQPYLPPGKYLVFRGRCRRKRENRSLAWAMHQR
jgi:CRISPR-associated protein Cmr3